MSFEGIAPGRLDFLGGVADYSGALVLETPLQGAQTRVRILPTSAQPFTFHSKARAPARITPGPLFDLLAQETPLREVGRILRARLDDRDRWIAYPLGCLLALGEAGSWRPPSGAEILLESNVPEGAGVSSSAALELATLRAARDWSGHDRSELELAHLGQRAENLIANAPCGLMDQLTAALGKPGALLPILCRPDLMEPPISLPPGLTVTGWISGVRHQVGASPYTRARTAAFMGKKWIEQKQGHPAEWTSALPLELTDELPEFLRGEDFLRELGSVEDPLSQIIPDRTYPVRAATRFPIEETRRSREACSLLRSPRPAEEIAVRLGELLFESHHAYTTIGLGHPTTDEMVRAISAQPGAYGARISGGGAGGTVVVLAETEALDRLKRRLPLQAGWVA